MLIDELSIDKKREGDHEVWSTGVKIWLTQPINPDIIDAVKIDGMDEYLYGKMRDRIWREFLEITHENIIHELDKKRNVVTYLGMPVFEHPSLKEGQAMIIMHPADLAKRIVAHPSSVQFQPKEQLK